MSSDANEASGSGGKGAMSGENVPGNGNGNNDSGSGEKDISGSPPETANGNGAVVAQSHTTLNGNANGHGYPRSGSHSPNQSGIDEKSMAVLQMLDLNLGTAEMAPKYAKGTLLEGEKQLDIVTNVYGLKHEKPLNVNAIHIILAKVTINGKYPFASSKRFLPDYTAVMRRRFYQQVMPLFYQKYATLFGENEYDHLVDYANTMYSFAPLNFDDEKVTEKLLELTIEEAASVTKNASVSLSLKRGHLEFMGNNFSGVCRDLDAYDASVLRFTELATSHSVAQDFKENCMFNNNKTYFMNPSKYGYPGDATAELGNGKFLAIGAEKSVILIEGTDSSYSVFSGIVHSDGNSLAAVVIESKKTPFYLPLPLRDIVCQILKIQVNDSISDQQIALLQPLIRNLACHRTYGNTTIGLVMTRLSSTSATEQLIPGEGEHGGISVEQYFRQRYNVTLNSPHWPLVEMCRRGISHFFPIEVLTVADFQRVKYGMLKPDDIKQIIRFCAIPPHRKREEIQRSYRAFNINDDEFCKNAGISVTGEPLKVTARVLSPPQIFYANGQVNVAEGKWRLPKFAKFISTSSCQKWVAVLVDYQFPRPFEFEKLRAFCNDFLEECRIRGMSFAGPQDVVKISPDDAALDKLFNDAYKVGIEFILLAHPDGETILHDHIKTFERKYMVVTQCVRTSTIDKVIGKQSKLTLENFIAKTNVKLGGLNYDVFLKDYEIDRKTLFIGIGMNHPGGGKLQQEGANESSVSILGYSANDSHDPGAFIGNFFVQPPFQDENLSILDDLMDEVLGRFKRNRGCAPSRVVVYRSGCSEGQFQRVLLYEVPIILHFVKKYNSAAPVTFIVPSVLHNVRLFKKDIDPSKRSPEQNIPPGTVVDTTIVHSKFLEFYLNSHTAIQGTAKTPRYTVVFTSETHATLDIFERWTNALCYSYQIVASPVSVPAPVYVANCYAERGRQIANNFGLTKLTAAQKENGLAFSAEDKPEEGKQEIVKKSYSYNFTHRPTLRDRRINA